MNKGYIIRKKLSVLLCILLVLSLVSGCEQKQQVNTSETEKGTYTAGAYTVESKGHGGPVELEVTFTESEISDINIIKQTETEGLGDLALERIKEDILINQSLDVDVVSGATSSSNAMLLGVEDAVKLAGGDIEALKANAIEKGNEGKVEALEADVVVVGAGASGVAAAVSAADKGAKVIIIEKTGIIGGASNLSWAGKFYNSAPAIESGLVVDEEKEIADWIVNNHWRVDAAAIRQYVSKSGETYSWLAEKGYVTQFINFFGEQLHMLPPYDTREVTLRKILSDSVEVNGGQVITETTAKKLITNENGEVVGVIAEKLDASTLEIKAKSVIMATGGYAANKEMVKEYFGFEGVNGGLGQNIGEGLMMSWDVGAKVPDNVGGQMLHQTLARATSDLRTKYKPFEASYPMMLTYLPNFMNVGTSGARFRDETATLTAVAAANTSAFNGPFHYVIVSQSQLDLLVNEGLNGVKAPRLPGMPPEFYADFVEEFTLENPWENAENVFNTMVENGHGFKGNTIQELAKNAGMDEELFVKTYNNYQDAIKTAIDSEFGKSADYLLPMGEEGPYYAIIAEINNLGSVGGLLVNTNFQVLNDNRIPIKGLYAVGLESEGVLFNDTYVGNGVGMGYAFTSGRLGGESAAIDAIKSK